jgi:phage gp36-like protein
MSDALDNVSVSDFRRYGLPNEIVDRAQSGVVDAALSGSIGTARSYLASIATPPYETIGEDVRMRVCHIAAYYVLAHVGYNPNRAGDEVVMKRHDDAIRWFELCARGMVTPSVTEVSGSTGYGVQERGASVYSDVSRGWNVTGSI